MPKAKTHYGTPHGDTAVPLCGTLRHADTMTPFPETVTCQRCQRALERPEVFLPTWPPAWLPPTAWPSSVYAKHHGGCCPVCQAGDITGKSFDCEAHVVWQDVHCQRCGAAWQDVYYLQGYDRLDLTEYAAPVSADGQQEGDDRA
jgi:hypothetical protein